MIDHTLQRKLIRVPSLNNPTSLHFLLNSILIAEATMAQLRLSLLLTILLSIGQTTRQTDIAESKNVSRSFGFLTFIDSVVTWPIKVVPDRRTLYLAIHCTMTDTSSLFNFGRAPRTGKRSSLSGIRNSKNRNANSATRTTSSRSSTFSKKDTNRLADCRTDQKRTDGPII